MKLEVENGSFSYTKNKMVFKEINFALGKGQVLSILGQNGIGKTTLLKCLTGILPWSSGQIRIDGKVASGKLQFKDIAYVPQAKGNAFPFTVLDIVCMGRTKMLHFYSMPSDKDWDISMQCLERLGLKGLENRLCTELSGGQLQLVYIARALASKPKLLLLDEPEAHLDFKNQRHIMCLIAELAQSGEISCIINTHHPESALEFSDLTLILGQKEYVFGKTSTIMSEDNVRRFFHIDSRIIDLSDRNIDKKAFVFI
ncbi:ABC transporter ATP-binding protein [Paenibacillus sp. GXUN7292]|uniref:ABC transporter ATP-binding protein n=1 Tax=Paenibacillus sp. GXUN7292 TaxID=3422499 RepID=UPI003D7EBD42